MGFTFYDWRKNAHGDFFGGLNAAIVAIPLAMAFGVESGLGAFSAGADWLVPYLKENPSPHLREMVIQKSLGLDELDHRLN